MLLPGSSPPRPHSGRASFASALDLASSTNPHLRALFRRNLPAALNTATQMPLTQIEVSVKATGYGATCRTDSADVKNIAHGEQSDCLFDQAGFWLKKANSKL